MHTTEHTTDEYGRSVTTHDTTPGPRIVVVPEDFTNQVTVYQGFQAHLSFGHNNAEGAGRELAAMLENAYHAGRHSAALEIKDAWSNSGKTLSQAVAEILEA